MAIIVNIDVMLAKRKMKIGELSRRTEISVINLSILKNGRANAVKMLTIDKLCNVLDCKPGDLFDYSKEPLPQNRTGK